VRATFKRPILRIHARTCLSRSRHLSRSAFSKPNCHTTVAMHNADPIIRRAAMCDRVCNVMRPRGHCRAGVHGICGVALSSLLFAVLVPCADGLGGVGWAGASRAAVLLSSLAMLQIHTVQGATPPFSTFFPSESCCEIPNFLNENVAPELKRCKQVLTQTV